MQELFSRPHVREDLSSATESYELRLDDSLSDRTVFCVTKAHARWDDVIKKVVWDERQVWEFETLQAAKEWYAKQRLTLDLKGFGCSDRNI